MATKHRIKGKMNEAAGSVQKNLGKATDNPEMEAKGQGREMKGKAENTWGKMGDAANEAKDTIKDGIKGD